MESTKQFNSIFGFDTVDFGSLFELCSDGIAFKDAELNYLYFNKAFCKLFDINSVDNIKNKFPHSISEYDFKSIIEAEIEIGKTFYPITYIIVTNSGKVLNITSSPIVKDSKFCGIITIAKDITQEENLKTGFVNKHFEYVNTEKQLQKQRETFVASVGHDLKNPTIAQIRTLELLLNGNFGEITQEQKELLSMILDSCRYMKGMLSSLLETYRNYEGAVKLNFTDFSLTELVKECRSEMQYVANDKELKFKEIGFENNNILEADRIQIKRVIMNLITNAIKYAYKNSTLILRILNKNKQITFEFENESPYIPPDKQEKIFSKYASFSGSNNELGTGLGLYASKRIIESHGGEIYFESRKNNSNIFGFKIPEYQLDSSNKEVRF